MTSLQVSTAPAGVAVRDTNAVIGWYGLFLGRDSVTLIEPTDGFDPQASGGRA